MKTQTPIPLVTLALAVFLGCLPSARAASFTEAEFTRLDNDVKVLKENNAPHAAAVGESVKAVTSVATGVNSRAELRFPDKSLTRIGANSRFTIRGQERTLDLDQGVMMLQVPKKMGGAKIRTAAVTAAVTGTTGFFEYLPGGYIKIIVVEGIIDVYSNKNKSSFQEVHAGQMIIMAPDATTVPPPVDVDLKRLLRTSRLLNMYENLPNTNYVNQAVLEQQKLLHDGTLLNTNLVIPGLGTFVSIIGNDTRTLDGITLQNPPTKPTPPPNPGNNNNNNPGPPLPPPIPPKFQGFLPLISGTTVLNNTSTIVPDPTVTAFNTAVGGTLTSQGLIYHGQAVDGPLAYWVFGNAGRNDPLLQSFVNASNGWGSYKFESLFINGTPEFDIPDTESEHITDVLLASNGAITLSGTNPFGPNAGGPDGWCGGGSLDLGSTGLTGLVLYSLNGGISLESNFRITGNSQDLVLKAQGFSSDVHLQGSISLGKDSFLIVEAGQDVLISNKISAGDITIKAGRDVVISGNSAPPPTPGPTSSAPVVKAKNGDLSVTARGSIQVTNSAQLIQLANAGEGGINGLLRLQSQKGNITLSGNVQVCGDNVNLQAFSGSITILTSEVTANRVLAARANGANGALTIGDSTLKAGTLLQLYAEGAGGSVVFTGDTTLSSLHSGPSTPSEGPPAHPTAIVVAAMTVEVALGKVVTITKAGPVRIFTDNALFNTIGYGSIMRLTPTGLKPLKPGAIQPYANRPKFNGNPAFGARPKPGPGHPPFAPPFPKSPIL